jgi:hypothetical protein
MSSNDRDDYLWDGSGDPDPELDELTRALAGQRAPKSRRFQRRWWLGPAIGGLLAAVAATAFVSPARLPAQVVGLAAGERGAGQMMIEGGIRLELKTERNLAASTVNRIEERLAGGGFDVIWATGELIVVELPGKEAQFEAVDRLEKLGLLYPVYLGLLAPADAPGLPEVVNAARAAGFVPSGEHPAQLVASKPRAQSLILDSDLRAVAGAFRLGLSVGDGETRLFVLSGTRLPARELAGFETRAGAGYLRLSEAGRRAIADRPEGASVALIRPLGFGPTFADLVLAVADPSADLIGEEIRFEASPARFEEVAKRFVSSDLGGLVELGSGEPVAPSLDGTGAWVARALFGAILGLLGFAILAIAARGARPLDPLVDRSAAPASRLRLVLSALLAAGLVAIVSAPLVTGPFASAINILGGFWRATTLFGLGTALVATGFALFLLVSLAAPRWRRALLADPRAGRRGTRLGLIATVCVTAGLVAAAQLEAGRDLLGSARSGPQTALYIAGAALAALAVVAAGRRALGGPWLCLILGSLIGAAVWFGPDLREAQEDVLGRGIDGGAAGSIVLLAVAVVGLSWRLLSLRFGSPTAPTRAPVGGVLPLALAIGVLEIAQGLGGPSLDRPLSGLFIVIAAVALPLWAVVAALELRTLGALGLARVAGDGAGEGRRGRRLALAASAGFLLALAAVEAITFVPIGGFAVIAALATAAVMDLVAELRARWRRPSLAPAADVHHPQLADMVARALDSQGLDVHLRAAHLRRCLGILGAIVPITVMVEQGRIGEAREIIDALLGCQEAADQASGAV